MLDPCAERGQTTSHAPRPPIVLELPGCPVLDKGTLIGGCTRLRLQTDPVRLREEIDALPAEMWGSRGGRVGVHRRAEAIFLRGHAPAEGDKPIEDRPALDALAYIRDFIRSVVPGAPMRCLLARLPPGALVAPHVDRAPYFHQTIRLHLPVITSDRAHMFCAGQFYRMRPGEVWALNNVAVHAVWNADPAEARTHLICDFVPDPALFKLLQEAERGLGSVDPERERQLSRQVAEQAP